MNTYIITIEHIELILKYGLSDGSSHRNAFLGVIEEPSFSEFIKDAKGIEFLYDLCGDVLRLGSIENWREHTHGLIKALTIR